MYTLKVINKKTQEQENRELGATYSVVNKETAKNVLSNTDNFADDTMFLIAPETNFVTPINPDFNYIITNNGIAYDRL